MKRSLTEVASSIRNGETKSEAVVRECLDGVPAPPTSPEP